MCVPVAPETFEQGREADTLGEMDRRYFQSREDDRKRRGLVDDAKAQATVRSFQTRSGVSEEPGLELPSVGPIRTIRRFGNSNKPVDPDAAMSAEEKARLDPRVLAAETSAAGDLAAARLKTSPQGGRPSKYSTERGRRIVQSVQDLTKRVSGWTAGYGSLLSAIPETQALDFDADLETLKSNIATGELTAMREASKTGGALGNVSDRELSRLEAALGSLNTKQSPANLLKNLRQIEDSINIFADASAQLAPEGASAPMADDPYEAYQRRRRR